MTLLHADPMVEEPTDDSTFLRWLAKDENRVISRTERARLLGLAENLELLGAEITGLMTYVRQLRVLAGITHAE